MKSFLLIASVAAIRIQGACTSSQREWSSNACAKKSGESCTLGSFSTQTACESDALAQGACASSQREWKNSACAKKSGESCTLGSFSTQTACEGDALAQGACTSSQREWSS